MTNKENLTKETYTHGYGRSQQTHLRRNADSHAGFFTPHLKKGMRVLDCGCGPGSITLGLAEIVDPGETVGIDIGATVIETANMLAADQKNASFQEGSIYEIPFPDSYFDAVFVHKVLEHLAEPLTAMQEVYRVLKPGGVVGTRNTDRGAHIWWPPSELVGRLFSNQEKQWRSNGGNPNFGREQQACLRNAGFIELDTTSSVELTNNAGSGMVEDLRAGQTAEMVDRGLLTEVEAADPEMLESYAKQFEVIIDDPDSFVVIAIDFMTVGRKPSV